MSKVQFRIGGAPGVMFNLPSRKVGDATVLEGKVVMDIYGLKCSERLSFDQVALLRLCANAKKLFEKLKGEASISSLCESFHLTVTSSSTGGVRIEASMKKNQFSQPNNAEWQANGVFYDLPSCLVPLINSADGISS